MRPAVVVLALLTVVAAAVALAQEGPAPQQGSRPYAGVVPGTGNLAPRSPPPGGNLLMTWPGFQQRPDGASRFFLQTTAPVQIEERAEANRFVLVLKNTGLHLRNNRRPLETRYFNTPVRKADIERRGRDLAFVLDLRAQVRPVVSQEAAENGYNFIFLSFPAGSFLPEDLRLERVERPAGPPRSEEQAPSEGTTEIYVY